MFKKLLTVLLMLTVMMGSALTAVDTQAVPALLSYAHAQELDDSQQEEPWEKDGSKIESIDLTWLTPDSTVDNEGNAVEDTNPNHLYLATKSDAEQNLTFQFEVAFSGQYDYAPGDIQITFPAQVFHGRKYELMVGDISLGIVDPDRYVGSMDLSVPAAPSAMADFNWQKINGNYVLTNTRTIGATSKAMFQVSIIGITPHDVVDMSICDPISVTCEVVTTQNNIITRTSEPITAQLDTQTVVESAHKATNNELYEDVPSSIPQTLLDNLPAGADKNDYIYVRWYSYVYHEGNQPFSLQIKDTLSTAYKKVTGDDGSVTKEPVTEGIFLGSTNYDGTILHDAAHDFEALVWENTYHQTTTQRYDHPVYMWSAYKKSDFYVPRANETQITYVMENAIDWILTEDDTHNVTTASAQTEITYSPIRWEKPVGHFEVFKYTENAPKEDVTYGYALNRLKDGEDIPLNFHLVSVGFGYPWTTPLTQPGVVADHEISKADMGVLGWKQVTHDFQTFFNNSNTPLTWEDYEIDALRVDSPTRYVYAKTSVPCHGYYEQDGVVVHGAIPAGRYGYLADLSLPIPDLKIEYQLKGDGQWRHAATATWGTNGTGRLSFTDVSEGITYSDRTVYFPENTTDVRHSFVSNVFGGKAAQKCDTAAIIWDTYPSMTLKATDRIVSIAQDLFTANDTPSTKFKNDVRMDVYGWVGADSNGTDLELGAKLFDTSRATLGGASYGVTMSKDVHFNSLSTENNGDNDVERKQIKLHYSAMVHEQSNLTNYQDYQEALANGTIPTETYGVWYDLLPPDVYPLLDTIKLRSDDTLLNAYTITNYKDSGRILLVVEARLVNTPVFRIKDTGYSDEPTISFDAIYSWESLNTLGNNLVNYIAFESKSENLPGNMLGSIKNERGEPDNPRGGSNVTTPSMPDDIAELLTDLDPNTDEKRFVYAKSELNAVVNTAAVSGISKSVMNDLNGIYSQGLANQEQVSVYEGENYTYRLRIMSSKNTQTKDIIIYDSIENYQLPEPSVDITKQEDYLDQQSKKGWQGEWEGKGQWRGTLKSVDLREFVRFGAKPVLYYSLLPGLTFPDSSAGTTQDGALELFSKGPYDLSDTNFWQQAELSDKGVWTVPDELLGKISAVAIDARSTADGGQFILEEGKSISSYLHMTAPDDNGSDDVWKAKGAFAHKTDADGNPIQEIDWEKATDPANNMYAYNNTRLKCVQSGTNADGESTDVVIRNDYTRVGILTSALRVNKIWKDQNNHDNIRPDEVTITLLRKTSGAAGDYEPVLDSENCPVTVTLNSENDWSAVFEQVDIADEDGRAYLYSIEESDVPGYTMSMTRTKDNAYRLTNTHANETSSISGTKTWDDNDNALGLRPDRITVKLYRNGVYYKSTTASPDANGNWTYSFGNLEKYEYGGKEYEYTIEEEYVPKYVAQSEGYLKLTNTYYPLGNLSITKKLINATNAASEKAFTFTVTLLSEPTGEGEESVPLMDDYDYVIYQMAPDSTEWMETPVSAGKITSGGHITLKYNQKAVILNLPSESVYRVEETELPGFTLTKQTNSSGSIRAGQTIEAEFTNRYSSRSAAQIALNKTLTGQAMRKNLFSFELVDITEGSTRYGTVIRTANTGTAQNTQSALGEPIISKADAYFGELTYTDADDGKTFYYLVREVNDELAGYTYDNTEYIVKVTVSDNGDGTMTIRSVLADTDADVSGSAAMSFANSYEADGETTIRAWKRLLKRDLTADEFEFELYKFDPATGDVVGDPIETVTNDAEGNVVFSALKFDQDDVSLNTKAPESYYYMVREKPGADNTVIYSKQSFVFGVTAYDNKDGTLSFAQSLYSAERNMNTCKTCSGSGKVQQKVCSACQGAGKIEGSFKLTTLNEAPVFINDLEDGSLTVTKSVTGKNADLDQKFTFYVRLTGENIPDTLRMKHDGFEDSDTPPASDENCYAGMPRAVDTSKHFHATDEQLQGGAYAVLDNGNLTFFRSGEEMLDHLDRSFTMGEGSLVQAMGDGRVYFVVDENTTEKAYRPWVSYILSNDLSVSTISFADAIRPKSCYAFFSELGKQEITLEGIDLLDTSLAVDMSKMFSRSTIVIPSLASFDTSNVTDMSEMFARSEGIPEVFGLPSFKTGKVTNMKSMFEDCSNLTQLDVCNFNTVNVADMSFMFKSCSNLTQLDICNFYTVSVSTMESMFEDCSSLPSLDVSNLYTYFVSNMKNMFRGCTNLVDLNLGTVYDMFQPRRVTNLSGMFSYCTKLSSLDLSCFDTWYTTDMSSMFKGCYSLESIKLSSSFYTNNVTDMSSMFEACYSLESIDLSSFSTPKVTNFNSMFADCYLLTELDLSSFYKGVTTRPSNIQAIEIFRNCYSLEKMNISGIYFYNGSSSASTNPFRNMFVGVNGLQEIIRDNTALLDAECYLPSNFPFFSPWKRVVGAVNGQTNMGSIRTVLTPSSPGMVQTMAGTWQYLNPSKAQYSFNANGGTGAMQTIVKDYRSGFAFKSAFYRAGYKLTGFTDSRGRFWAVDEYGIVIIPAYSFTSAGNYTFTAVWEEEEYSVEITDGVFSFTLKDGQTATFPSVPAGVTYEIWEDLPKGWNLESAENAIGTISPLTTSSSTFTNNYDPTKAQVALEATKLMDGVTAKKGAFEFELVDAETGEQIACKYNADNGIIRMYLTYDTPGTYVYELRERAGNDDNIIYDTTAYTIEVTVVDDGEGVLTASAEYYKGEEKLDGIPVFRNATKPGSLKLTKTIDGDLTDEAEEQEFTFEVSFKKNALDPWNGDNDGKVHIQGGDPIALENGKATVTLKGGESITFTDLPSGVRYEAKETGSLPGWTMDDAVFSGKIQSQATAQASFTNSYSAKGSATLEVIKNLIGRTPKDGEFTFELYEVDASGNEKLLQTKTHAYTQVLLNPDASIGETLEYAYLHLARFADLNYTQEGTYRYVILEKPGTDETVEYSSEKVFVTVNVEDKEGKGRLSAEVQYTVGDKSSNVITNRIKPGALELSKTVVNALDVHKDLKFTFTVYLTDALGYPLSGEFPISDGSTLNVINGSGTLRLGDGESVVISNLPDGANYTVAETAEPGFAQRSTHATGSIFADQTAQVRYTNTYRAEGSYQFEAAKILEGAELKEEQFMFELLDADGNTLSVAKNAEDGSIRFDELFFDDSDAGTKTYMIREVRTGENGYTFDETVHTVVLTITDQGDGELTFDTDMPESGIVFTNTYSEYIDITATKVWKGDEENTELRRDIMLRLYAKDGADERVLVGEKHIAADASGDDLTVIWEDMPVFGEDSRAPIDYSVEEEMLLEEGENSLYTTVITGSAEEGFTVINRYCAARVDITAQKVLLYGTLEKDQFLFQITEGGAEVAQARNEADGTITFPTIFYHANDLQDAPADAEGNRSQTILYELAEVQEEVANFIYDQTVYTVEVKLVLDADGVLTAQLRIMNEEGEETEALFINEVKTTSFTVTKFWEDGSSGAIVLTLYANDEKLDPQPDCIRNGNTYTYSELPQYDSDGEMIVYSAKEKYVDGYVTIYNNIAPYANEIAAAFDGGTIINRVEVIPSLVVTKEWQGMDPNEPKPEITLTLYCNGKKTDTKTPKPNGHGQYRYYDLPKFVDGQPAEYTVMEEPLKGYGTTYLTASGLKTDCARHGGTIVNTKLPDTGDRSDWKLWLTGLCVSLIGLVLCCRKRTSR